MRALLVAAALLLWAVDAADAQMLEVAPVSVMFGPGQRTASLTVTNRSDAAVTIQIRPFVWRENDGKAELAETGALAVSPPFADVAPGQAQSIRLLLRQVPGAAEDTYRLLIDELPPASTPGVRVALRLSLPVFAQPAVRAAAGLVWQVVPGRSGGDLEVVNRGNRHATVISAQIQAPNGAMIPVRTSTHPYVLPGAMSRWPIGNVRLPGSGPVRLTVTTDLGVQEASASVVAAPP